jgi:hypothetical protein
MVVAKSSKSSKTKTKTKRCSSTNKSKACKYKRCLRKNVGIKMAELKKESGKSWPKKRQQAIAISIQYSNDKCKSKK